MVRIVSDDKDIRGSESRKAIKKSLRYDIEAQSKIKKMVAQGYSLEKIWRTIGYARSTVYPYFKQFRDEAEKVKQSPP
jgi:hypothetical protein